ncbi:MULTISPECIES: YchJ family protein [Pseudoalteromonas]|uniref:Preprotein translocase subunit SecA n=1 Tax=Pseudoalteromonas amylolytica TaxID=1859457 RepID=A0A1S1MS31_9GAMM|nr:MULTISPECIES: YchJ family protein [Pseudoalteromonas]OHU86574.1 preprotein translocase subunit SecA [Pseudoalteromonas sp. JW3]OHU88901.1 preprotein translocase subunit SecA [Pseudoalteromonas amylolytica]
MCYCPSEAPFQQCCEPFISGAQTPKTAEQLMRSRYSAYVVKNAQYIRATYAQEEKKHHSVEDILAFANAVNFIKLDILSVGDTNDGSFVEFQATYIADNKVCALHELSNFILEDGLWKYLDGHIYPTPEIKLGRNDMCPCGSGKKFKKCHST